MGADVILRAELMAMLCYRDRDAFRAWRARAERDEGFPKPLPGRTRPLAWSRAQVTAWLAGVAPSFAAANDAAPPASEGDELAEARARLRARSVGH